MAIRIDEPLEALRFEVTDDAWIPDAERAAAIERAWAARRLRDPDVYNGAVFVCHTAATAGPAPRLGLRRGDYRTYAWAREDHPELPGVQPLGTCAIVWDPDADAFVLARRSERVAFDRGKLSGFGGVVAWTPVTDFVAYLCASMREELAEECTAEIVELTYAGAYLDQPSLKLEFCFVARIVGATLRGWENVAVERVPRGELGALLRRDPSRFETSTRKHLEHLADRLDAGPSRMML